MDKQNTLAGVISISGKGLHTKSIVNLSILPAKPNTGIVFVRKDLDGNPSVPADVDFVTETSRGTTLEKGDAKVHTIEHLLSAIYGMQIDNAIVELDGPEIPILDGSAYPYVEAIEKIGIQNQEEKRNYYVITEPIRFNDPETGSEIIGLPDNQYSLSVMIDFNSKVLTPQGATFNESDNFIEDISKARTFVFLHEVEYLYKNNLIQGGDLNNAIVFVENELSDSQKKSLSELLNIPSIEVNAGNTLNNTTLNYTNEPARHKLLDLIGDLYLSGVRIKGRIIASKPGHKSNVNFAKLIKQHVKDIKAGKAMPYVDLNKKPLYDINQIAEFLPHRYPFLLVDKIIEMSDSHVVGLKNVTMNEPFFMGHFPGNPVMPGVMQIEAMAQVGGILAMNSVDDYKQYTPYFIKIESVKFKQKVLPGDTLIFILNLLSPIRRGICHMEGKAYVDGKVVMEAEMMAQLIKNDA